MDLNSTSPCNLQQRPRLPFFFFFFFLFFPLLSSFIFSHQNPPHVYIIYLFNTVSALTNTHQPGETPGANKALLTLLMTTTPLSYSLVTGREPDWTTAQEKSLKKDYPFQDLHEESDDHFVARTYLQFLWLPEV